MSEIYIAFVDTPGIFAGIIRRVIQQKYIHVVISMDPELKEAYSVGRRHPAIPLLAGFEKDEKQKIISVIYRKCDQCNNDDFRNQCQRI